MSVSKNYLLDLNIATYIIEKYGNDPKLADLKLWVEERTELEKKQKQVALEKAKNNKIKEIGSISALSLVSAIIQDLKDSGKTNVEFDEKTNKIVGTISQLNELKNLIKQTEQYKDPEYANVWKYINIPYLFGKSNLGSEPSEVKKLETEVKKNINSENFENLVKEKYKSYHVYVGENIPLATMKKDFIEKINIGYNDYRFDAAKLLKLDLKYNVILKAKTKASIFTYCNY